MQLLQVITSIFVSLAVFTMIGLDISVSPMALVIIVILAWVSLQLLISAFPDRTIILLCCQLLVGILGLFIMPQVVLLCLASLAVWAFKDDQINWWAFSLQLLALVVIFPIGVMETVHTIIIVIITLFLDAIYYLVGHMERYLVRTTRLADDLRTEKTTLAERLNQIQTAQRLEQQANLVAERQRLTHEIHDELGHRLTGGLIQMEAARHVYRNDPETGEQLIDQSIEVIREGIDKIRHLLRQQAKPLETINIQTIKNQLTEYERQYQIETSFEFQGFINQLKISHWQVIQANLTESLTNVVKHSQATQVAVSLKVLNQIIQFTVSNDGIVARESIVNGIGIIAMNQRTQQVGGQLHISNQKNFIVTTILPLKIELEPKT